MSWMDLIDLVMYTAAGAALGIFYFVLLLRTVRLHAAQASVARVVLLYLIRIAAAVAGFWLIAQHGAQPLLFALLGFLVARRVVRPWSQSV